MSTFINALRQCTLTNFKNYICTEVLAAQHKLADAQDDVKVMDVNDSDI